MSEISDSIAYDATTAENILEKLIGISIKKSGGSPNDHKTILKG